MASKFKFKFQMTSGIENVGVWLSVFLLSGIVFLGLQNLISPFAEQKTQERQKIINMEQEVEGPRLEGPDFSTLDFVENQSLAVLAAKQSSPLTRISNALEEGWDYGATSAKGPRQWSKLKTHFEICASGKRQSPIDIRRASKVSYLLPLDFNYPENLAVKIFNDGKIPRFSVDDDRQASILFREREYALKYIDVHFPSEHFVVGEKSEMEIQLVHESLSGHFLVISILGREKLRGSAALGTFLTEIPKKGHLPPIERNVAVRDLIVSPNEYYTYEGSWTHPPCTEDILWIVLAKRLDVSSAWTDEFVRRVGFNARAVQKTNGRVVGKSF